MQSNPGKPNNHQARREDQRRDKMNARFMKANEERLDQRTYQHLLANFQEKQRVRESGDQTAVAVPVTTRGIGLNITASFEYLEARHNKAIRYSAVDRNSLYRFSLVQLSKQDFESWNQHPGRDFDPLIHQSISRPPFNEKFNDLKVTDNLGLVANSILTIGTFSCFETIYRTFVPPMKTVEVAVTASTSTRATKRSAVADEAVIPDPYLVTIDNLRSVVEYLANPNNDLAVRQRFRKLDPIPGSEWNEHDVLVNPDDIMPGEYNARRFCRDQTIVSNFFANIKRYDKCYLGEMVLDGTGRRTALATTHQNAEDTTTWSDFSTEHYYAMLDFDAVTVRCLYPIGGSEMLFSLAALMTEWPVDWKQDEITALWQIRAACMSSFGFRDNWCTLVHGILSTIPAPLAGPPAN